MHKERYPRTFFEVLRAKDILFKQFGLNVENVVERAVSEIKK